MINEKYFVMEGMVQGGSFVRSLREVLSHADPINTEKIKETWPEYWDKYLKIGIKLNEAESNGLKEIGTKEALHNFTKKKADDLFKKSYPKNPKASLWVCHRVESDFEPLKGSKIARCEHCGQNIYYDPVLENKMKKNAKKICSYCTLNVKKFSKHVNKEQREIMEMSQ